MAYRCDANCSEPRSATLSRDDHLLASSGRTSIYRSTPRILFLDSMLWNDQICFSPFHFDLKLDAYRERVASVQTSTCSLTVRFRPNEFVDVFSLQLVWRMNTGEVLTKKLSELIYLDEAREESNVIYSDSNKKQENSRKQTRRWYPKRSSILDDKRPQNISVLIIGFDIQRPFSLVCLLLAHVSQRDIPSLFLVPPPS